MINCLFIAANWRNCQRRVWPDSPKRCLTSSANWAKGTWLLFLKCNISCIYLFIFILIYFRSYGSVYKALHKESGQVLAIKQVPVDTDLQEIIKEISIMQQCDSPYVVKYYGSYFKNTDLWVSISWHWTSRNVLFTLFNRLSWSTVELDQYLISWGWERKHFQKKKLPQYCLIP